MGQELDKSSVDAAVWKEAVAREAVIRALLLLRSAEPSGSLASLPPARCKAGSALPAFEGVSHDARRPVPCSFVLKERGAARTDYRWRPKRSSLKHWRNSTRPSRSRASIACIRKFGGYAARVASRRRGWHTLRARIDAIDPAELTESAGRRQSRAGSLSPGPRRILCRARL